MGNLIAIALCNAKYGDFNLDGGNPRSGLPKRDIP
jgi:hypothetical protein